MSTLSVSRRDLMRLGAAAGVTLAASPQITRAAQDVTLTFWNTGYPTEDPNDKTKPLEDFYIFGAIERFQEANPGIIVAMDNVPGETNMFTKYRTASVARNGPDVMGMWSGSYMLNLKDFIEPMGPYFTPEERSRIIGWEVVATDFDPNSDDIYGVPIFTSGCHVIFYNKELMAGAGVDPEASWPTNFDEFLALLETVQASGTTPLVLQHNSIILQVWSWWQAQTIGGTIGINEVILGERNFSDPEIVEITKSWQQLQPYALPGAESTDHDQMLQNFIQNQGAMASFGSSDIHVAREVMGDNLGMIKLPNYSPEAPILDGGIGGSGDCIIVSNYSEHKDEAVQFIKFLMSKEEMELYAASGEGGLLNVTDVDIRQFNSDPLMQLQQEWAYEPSLIFWPDNIYPAELTTELMAQSELAWTGQIGAEEFLAKLDAKRDELLGA